MKLNARLLIFVIFTSMYGAFPQHIVAQSDVLVNIVQEGNNTYVYMGADKILRLTENRYLNFRATNQNDHWIGETNKPSDLGWSYQDFPGYVSDSVTYQIQPGWFRLALYGQKAQADGKIVTTITAQWNPQDSGFEYTLNSRLTANLEKYYLNSKWAISSYNANPSASVQLEPIDYTIERISILDRIVGENPNPDLYDCFVLSADAVTWERIPKLHVAYPIYKGNWLYTLNIPLKGFWGFLDPKEGGWISQLTSCSGDSRIEICWSWQDNHFLITNGVPPRYSAETFTASYTWKFVPVGESQSNQLMNVAQETDWKSRPEYIRPVFSRNNNFEELINGYESQHTWFSSAPACKWDGTVGYHSNSSVSIEKTFDRTAAWYGWFYGYPFEASHINPQAKYRLTAMVKTENVSGKVRIAAVRRTSGPEWLYSNLCPANSWVLDKIVSDSLAGTNDWTELSVTFKSRDWSPTAISLELDGAGKCWFDSVVISKVTDDENSEPKLSYSSPQVFMVGKAIAPLVPTITGESYGTVTTVGSIGGQAQSLAFSPDFSMLYAPLSQAYKVNKVAIPYDLSLMAGMGVKGSGDGASDAARFSQAFGVAVHPSTGDIYVADADSNVIKKINAQTAEVTNYAGVKGIPSTIDGDVSVARFSGSHGLAFDDDGNLYVTQTGSGAIRKINAAGTTVSTLVSGGNPAYFKYPWNATYKNGYLYVTEELGHKVSKVNVSSGEVTAIAGSGTAGYADGIGPAAFFTSPRGVAVDAAGNVFVADYGNNRIRKITPDGLVATVAGNGTASSTDGTGSAASFKSPAGIALDGSGNLYVADAASQLLRKVAIVDYSDMDYSIIPALPEGLILNAKTGEISGTPITSTPSTAFTIIASSPYNSLQAVLTLAVNLPNSIENQSKNFLTICVNKNTDIRIYGKVNKNTVADLYDLQGRRKITEKLNSAFYNSIPIHNIEKGLYMLFIKDDKGSQSRLLSIG
jgi:hypothetical protein